MLYICISYLEQPHSMGCPTWPRQTRPARPSSLQSILWPAHPSGEQLLTKLLRHSPIMWRSSPMNSAKEYIHTILSGNTVSISWIFTHYLEHKLVRFNAINAAPRSFVYCIRTAVDSWQREHHGRSMQAQASALSRFKDGSKQRHNTVPVGSSRFLQFWFDGFGYHSKSNQWNRIIYFLNQLNLRIK